MENDLQKWRIRGNQSLCSAFSLTFRSMLMEVLSNPNPADKRPVIPIGHGDPSAFPCFRTTPDTVEALTDALHLTAFNGYSSPVGILPARQPWDLSSVNRAIAKYLSKDLPYELTPDDVYLTVSCNQAIDVVLTTLTSPGVNILLPRPGFPYYESMATLCKLEVRHFDLIPEKGWEVDLDSVEALADGNTVAMVIINPGNPCGSVYTREHLQKVAKTARKLGILVIADEVYGHLTFGTNPFVPMGTFGSIAPVLTLGSISKRWVVPGWRLGWLATTDPCGILKKYGLTECIKGFLNGSSDPVTFIQGAIPQLLEKTKDDFFSKIIDSLGKDVDICWEKLKEIPCITCPSKPQGGMFAMAKLNLFLLDGIKDDINFCNKLAKEECVIILPGVAVGLKNWIRISFAIEPVLLEEALERMKAFCQRHEKKC